MALCLPDWPMTSLRNIQPEGRVQANNRRHRYEAGSIATYFF